MPAGDMLDLLEKNEGIISLAVLVGGFVVLSFFETVFPRRRPSLSMGWRWLNNISLALVTIVLAKQVQVVLSLVAAWWLSNKEFGLFQAWQPAWGYTLVITLLALDFSHYVYHRLLHRVPLLWRLHTVHHSDT
jgi:sterol desaturase/sphingolipid hydroxylase (fatty acid hydroxylase superfamily)